jgi:methylmalonyl-CoA mutase C-terminal domain/subunit
MDRRIRILVCKPGLDGHDRGGKVIARALVPRVLRLLRERGIDDVLVVPGGTDADAEELRKLGVAAVFSQARPWTP